MDPDDTAKNQQGATRVSQQTDESGTTTPSSTSEEASIPAVPPPTPGVTEQPPAPPDQEPTSQQMASQEKALGEAPKVAETPRELQEESGDTGVEDVLTPSQALSDETPSQGENEGESGQSGGSTGSL